MLPSLGEINSQKQRMKKQKFMNVLCMRCVACACLIMGEEWSWSDVANRELAQSLPRQRTDPHY
jgi:type VI protein secretion system component VasK